VTVAIKNRFERSWRGLTPMFGSNRKTGGRNRCFADPRKLADLPISED
jgi:hypothetical protein